MFRRTAITCLLVFALPTPALATKFHLADKDEDANTVGNGGNRVIEGVILEEGDQSYSVRVVGGQLVLQKSWVKRIENDGLTVARIERMEQASERRVESEERRRRRVQAEEAAARREATAQQVEAAPTDAQSVIIEVDFQGLLPGYTFRTYDPVLHRANLSGLRQLIEDYLRREVKKAAHRH